MSEELYYLQDSRQYVGNSMLWWCATGGYTCDIRQAEVFTKEKAFGQHKSRDTDLPWPKSYIEARISHHIDHQQCKRREALGLVKRAKKRVPVVSVTSNVG